MHVPNLDCNRTHILTNPPTLLRNAKVLNLSYKKFNYCFNLMDGYLSIAIQISPAHRHHVAYVVKMALVSHWITEIPRSMRSVTATELSSPDLLIGERESQERVPSGGHRAG